MEGLLCAWNSDVNKGHYWRILYAAVTSKYTAVPNATTCHSGAEQRDLLTLWQDLGMAHERCSQ